MTNISNFLDWMLITFHTEGLNLIDFYDVYQDFCVGLENDVRQVALLH